MLFRYLLGMNSCTPISVYYIAWLTNNRFHTLKYNAVLELCVLFLEIQCLSTLLHADVRLQNEGCKNVEDWSNKSEVLSVKEADSLL